MSDKELKEFKKHKLDLLNWAKSDLSQEENPKLGKTMNPYRIEKIRFLREVIKRLKNKI